MNLAIFDIDGTLTESFGFDAHFFAALSRRLDVPDPGRPLGSWKNVTDEGIVHEYFEMHDRRVTAEDIEWTKAEYGQSLRAHMHRVPQIAGVSAFLGALRADPDWHVAIATGNWTFAGELKLDAGGVERADITVVGCDDRPRRTTVMEHALRLSAAEVGPIDRHVYIGDAHYDVAASCELGWNFVGVNADPERLTSVGATTVIPNFLDADAAFDALRSAGTPMAVR